ncbi:MAG: ATP-dependent DNA helicase [Gammaproteobacteria bacterium]|nr:ATP-dependent DNA helicase [Gammaproteobacteria bacterium]
MFSSAADVLGPDGPFKEHFPGFTSRPQQQELASAIETALQKHTTLVAEAGTGTGKTLSYLVPVLLSGKKVLISTGTKNLQDQLFLKDLPAVIETLDVPVRIALLKGRANYLCPQRLERKNLEGRFHSREQVQIFNTIKNWSYQTQTGDLAELADIPEDSPVWPMVTSTTDNCLGGDCPQYDKCHVVEARRQAQAADIVVVNHHLFFADIALRDEGVGELLPAADAVVFDEAHQLPEVATHFYGVNITLRQINELCTDAIAAAEDEAKDQLTDLRPLADETSLAGTQLHASMLHIPARGVLPFLLQQGNVPELLNKLDQSLTRLHAQLEIMAVRGKELENCFGRVIELMERLHLVKHPQNEFVHWYDVTKRNFALHMSPISIADNFREQLKSYAKAWIFTSATLSVDGDFSFFTSRLGLDEVQTCRWPSPFNYQDHGLLYVPPMLPPPNAPDFVERMLDKVLPVLNASAGRAFLLFTSHRALRLAEEILRKRTDFTLLVQGNMGKRKLLEEFRRQPRAVLLGSASFWEGVDVKGDDLSVVVIDKLPFATPGDPLMAARLDHLRKQGGNPFNDYQVPQAVIALEQGVGRLIRDENDYGVVVICDTRIVDKNYGKTFLRSLPPMPLTRDEAVVTAFLTEEVPQ